MLSTTLLILFIGAYLLIAFEHSIKVNKAAVALVSGVMAWVLVTLFKNDHSQLDLSLSHHLSEISGILFFLMGAMTIVELIDAHGGFVFLTRKLSMVQPSRLIWVLAVLSFVLSALLDNLTTTILMVSLLVKLLPEGRLRLLYTGFVVIAANAGGAWSPIGDVTTTMLWLGGQLSTFRMISDLILPSLINLLVPMLLLKWIIRRNKLIPEKNSETPVESENTKRGSLQALLIGLSVLVSVPLFKTFFHLPPYMGMLFGLGFLWCLTEILNGRRDDIEKENYSVAYALRKIDTGSILFFLGILLSISALDVAGVLENLSANLNAALPDKNAALLFTGFLSSIIDNVPLVAAYQGMYSLNEFPKDSAFWQLLAYCSGTGGSMLIIGSAAGVVAMGIEKISFTWYLKNIGWMALAGYLAGFVVYVLGH